MDLNTVSVVVEWAARLTAPAICFLVAIASAVAAVINLGDGQVMVAAIAVLIAAVTCMTASVLAVQAIRRLRSGPPTPPSESL